MKTFMMSLACLAFVFGASQSRADGIKEGQWSMTMTVKMDGALSQEMADAQKEMDKMSPEEKAMMQQMMGKMGMQMGGNGMTINTKQCITNQNPVPKQDDQEDCSETHSIIGNTVKFDMTCKDSRSSGEVSYDNDSMKGSIKSLQHQNGQDVNATIDIKGQFEGPCKN